MDTQTLNFNKVHFVTSAPDIRHLPNDGGVEIAFAGRSNAGKSSAINTLVGHTRLAFVSKTPGRTQLINYFTLVRGGFLVDLPGYGYAQVPIEVRKAWAGLIERYLKERESLAGLVLIMDARHPLTPLDWNMIEWFSVSGKPMHVLLTKADKLTRSAQAATLADVRRQLSGMGEQVSVQLFSSLKKTGVEEAEAAVSPWLAAHLPDQASSTPV